MIEYFVQNIPPVILRVRVEQRLGSNTVREQKYDAQHGEIEQFHHLQYIADMLNVLELLTHLAVKTNKHRLTSNR